MTTTRNPPEPEEAAKATSQTAPESATGAAKAESTPQDLAQAALLAAVEANPDLERATVTLPTEALKWLRDEASKRGITTGEMLRTAIGTQKYLLEKIANGAKVQVKDSSGTLDLIL